MASRFDRGLTVMGYQGRIVDTVARVTDDLFMVGNNGMTDQTKEEMKDMFCMYQLRSVIINLTINIEHNWEHLMIIIYPHCYIWMMLAKFSKDESTPVATLTEIKLHKCRPNRKGYH
jgi:hypothetical protein